MIFNSFTFAQLIVFIPFTILSLIHLLKRKSTFSYISFISLTLLFSSALYYGLPQDYGENVYNVGGFFINSYLINTTKGYVLVDTGLPFNYYFFKWNLHLLNVQMSEIKYIVITHFHFDHVGFLPKLLEVTNATVILNKMTDERMESGNKSFTGGCSNKLTKYAYHSRKTQKTMKIPENRKQYFNGHQILIREGFNLTLLFLPGHVLDQIGVQLKDGRLICGDMAMNGILSSHFHPIYVEDLKAFKKSWNYAKRANIKRIFAGHGHPITIDQLMDNIMYLDSHPLLTLE